MTESVWTHEGVAREVVGGRVQRRQSTMLGVLRHEASGDARKRAAETAEGRAEIRRGDSGVRRHGSYGAALGSHPALQLEGEQHVGLLGICVRATGVVRPSLP